MYIAQEITPDEINKVRNEMSPDKARDIVINSVNKELYVWEPYERKFGNKIGYAILVTYSEDRTGIFDEIFVESNSGNLGVFMRGFGFVSMSS